MVDEHVTGSAPIRVKALRVSNYRSLGEDIVVDFGALTVLVGTNGSGKSNILDVFRFFREALTYGLEPAISKRLGIKSLRRAAPFKPRAIKLGVDLQAGSWFAYYDVQINAATAGTYRVERETLRVTDAAGSRTLLDVQAGKVRTAPAGLAPVGSEDELVLPAIAADPQIRPVIDTLRSIRIHNIYPRELSVPQPVGQTPPLDETGSNWCAVLKSLKESELRDLRLALSKLTGDIRDVRVESSGGFYTAEFLHHLDDRTPRWFSAAQESDGTLRLAGILTAMLQTPAPGLLGVEEPELTINPGLLPLLYDYLQASSENAQVVITSHSPDLLNLIPIEDVRVVQRVKGATRIGVVAEDQRESVKEALLSPGSLLKSGAFRIEGVVEPNLFDLYAKELQ